MPVGRSDGDQLIELARLAETYGSGVSSPDGGPERDPRRCTGHPSGGAPQEPLLQSALTEPTAIARGTVSCTGIDYCSLALIESKGYARDTIAAIEASGAVKAGKRELVRLSCRLRNHQAADIGRSGRRTRTGDRVIETVDIL